MPCQLAIDLQSNSVCISPQILASVTQGIPTIERLSPQHNRQVTQGKYDDLAIVLYLNPSMAGLLFLYFGGEELLNMQQVTKGSLWGKIFPDRESFSGNVHSETYESLH